MKHEKVKLNMQTLRRSRKPLIPGDIFVLKAISTAYHLGRVVRTDIQILGGECILAYIYDATCEDMTSIPTLSKSRLLVPPQILGKYMWSKGYFQTVAHRDLQDDDVFKRHCFIDGSVLGANSPAYCDENGAPLDGRIEPCGYYSISLEGAVDDEVSDALGISRRRGGSGQ